MEYTKEYLDLGEDDEEDREDGLFRKLKGSKDETLPELQDLERTGYGFGTEIKDALADFEPEKELYLSDTEPDDTLAFMEETEQTADPDSDYFMNTPETLGSYETEEIQTIDPVTAAASSTFGDHSPTFIDRQKEQKQAYRDEHADTVREAVTEERFWHAAARLVGEDVETVRESLQPHMAQFDQDLVQLLRDRAVEEGEDEYVRHPDRYDNDPDMLVDQAVEDAAGSVIPTFPFRDDVDHRYTGQEIDPRAIQRHIVKRVGMAVAHQLEDITGEAAEMIHDNPVPAEYETDTVQGGPETVRRISSNVGESYMSVEWNSEHPSVQQTAAQAFLDDIGKAVQRAKQQADSETEQRLTQLQEQYENTLQRFRVDETLDALDRYWGTGDMPYDIYEIEDPDEMLRAARDIGNCRTSDSVKSYYEELADDEHATILGVRRHDEHEWIGMARLFHMEADDGRDILAIDNLGMQYKPGQEAGAPRSSCNFTAYGDAVPVMGLASIAYGLEEDVDTVIAGGQDGRVGGGPGDHIGVAQLYSTKNTDLETEDLEKKGERPIKKPWGLRSSRWDDRSHALLMEVPELEW